MPYGDSGLLVDWGGPIDPHTNARVHALASSIQAAVLPGAVECVPGYVSLLVAFDLMRIDYNELENKIKEILLGIADLKERVGRLVEIPVNYGGEGGPDLDFVARHCRLSEQEVIHMHSSVEYPVHFIGFLPGFPYLGGMDTRLATPRLEKPRQRVPAGSVGIAGGQTGIYPLDSPGGWRIIGRTKLTLFDAQRTLPALLAPGDRVRFLPVEGDR